MLFNIEKRCRLHIECLETRQVLSAVPVPALVPVVPPPSAALGQAAPPSNSTTDVLLPLPVPPQDAFTPDPAVQPVPGPTAFPQVTPSFSQLASGAGEADLFSKSVLHADDQADTASTTRSPDEQSSKKTASASLNGEAKPKLLRLDYGRHESKPLLKPLGCSVGRLTERDLTPYDAPTREPSISLRPDRFVSAKLGPILQNAIYRAPMHFLAGEGWHEPIVVDWPGSAVSEKSRSCTATVLPPMGEWTAAFFPQIPAGPFQEDLLDQCFAHFWGTPCEARPLDRARGLPDASVTGTDNGVPPLPTLYLSGVLVPAGKPLDPVSAGYLYLCNYARHAIRTAEQRLGPLSDHDDIIQQICVEWLEQTGPADVAFPKLLERAPVEMQLLRATVHRVIMRWSYQQRKGQINADLSGWPAPERPFERAWMEFKNDCERGVGQLTAQEKQILEMRRQGHTFAEIGSRVLPIHGRRTDRCRGRASILRGTGASRDRCLTARQRSTSRPSTRARTPLGERGDSPGVSGATCRAAIQRRRS